MPALTRASTPRRAAIACARLCSAATASACASAASATAARRVACCVASRRSVADIWLISSVSPAATRCRTSTRVTKSEKDPAASMKLKASSELDL